VVDRKRVAPTPPPRSLRTVKGIRLELTRLYGEGKRGEVDPQLLGRLVHLLSTLAAIVRDTEVEARLAALEAAAELEHVDAPWSASGRDRLARH
jgi:hypothetical protein